MASPSFLRLTRGTNQDRDEDDTKKGERKTNGNNSIPSHTRVTEPTTRRAWISRTSAAAVAVVSSSSSRGRPAVAATATSATTTTTTPKISVTSDYGTGNPYCDPGVSIWQRGSRKLYLLGTAHISEDSAKVAGNLVRSVRPTAVFVELDAKRVGRVNNNNNNNKNDGGSSTTTTTIAATNTSDGSRRGSTTSSDGSTTASVPPATSSSSSSATFTSTTVTASGDTGNAPTANNHNNNPFRLFKSKLLTAGQVAVGGAIKKLYQKLETQGFSAGEEFAVAIKEGLALNSTIVLGDRDVDVTLRRITEALSKTDLQNLLKADSDFERTMVASLPESVRQELREARADGSTGGGGGVDMDDGAQMSLVVETLKRKENVRAIMQGLKVAAPELYEALVGERDLYMARGLDGMDRFDDTVAVMGMAHLEGVENNLRTWGWSSVAPPKTCGLGA